MLTRNTAYRKKDLVFAHDFRGSVHHGWEGVAEKTSSHHGGQEANSDREGPVTKYCQGLSPNDLLPPARPHFLKFLEHPQVTLQPGDQVSHT
jgi:hypothetical protein